MRRVAILGAGALGSLFAYQLTSRTSAEVRLLAHSALPPALWLDGGGEQVPARAWAPADGSADLVLVLVKAYATREAAATAMDLGAVGPETVALTLQNGLGNAEALAELLGPGRVLAGTTAQGATLVAPGLVRHGGAGPTRIAPWVPAADTAAVRASLAAAAAAPAVAALLAGAGIPTTVEADPRPLLWAKLAVNCGINALTAILRVPNGELLVRPGARPLMEAAAREAAAVAAAEGIALPEDPVERVIAVARATAENRSSMLQDVERGRRTEVEAINGAVARRGEALGVPTPVNRTLADLVRGIAGQER
jgi:2-dehydropantoate 2-reductase